MLLVEISAKNDKFGYLNPILGKLGVTHDFGWWLVVEPMIDFLFALIELFSLSITVPELCAEMSISSAVFKGGRHVCIQILPDQGRPHQPFLVSEN